MSASPTTPTTRQHAHERTSPMTGSPSTGTTTPIKPPTESTVATGGDDTVTTDRGTVFPTHTGRTHVRPALTPGTGKADARPVVRVGPPPGGRLVVLLLAGHPARLEAPDATALADALRQAVHEAATIPDGLWYARRPRTLETVEDGHVSVRPGPDDGATVVLARPGGPVTSLSRDGARLLADDLDEAAAAADAGDHWSDLDEAADSYSAMFGATPVGGAL